MESSEMLRNFIDFFHNKKIPYVILGDTRKLPEKIDGDIDFSTHFNEKETSIFIFNFCKLYDLKLIQVLQHEHTANCYIITSNNIFIDIDICSDFYRNNIKYIESKELIKSKINHEGGFYISNPPVAFIYYFLKRFGKGDVSEKNLEYLKKQWQIDSEKCQIYLKKYFNHSNCSLITGAFNNSDFTQLLKLKEQVRVDLHNSKQVQPSLADKMNEFLRKIKRVLNPTGLHIVVLGMDGSGKSSVLEKVIPALAPAFRGTKTVHLRPHLGKTISTTSVPVTDPHAEPARSFLMSLVKLAYFWFDYTAGYFLTIKPKLIRSTLIVYDRYFHDMLVDPKRYRFGAPLFLARWIIKLTPQPDLIILLNVSAETAQSRKQEVSFDESTRQAEAYRKLVGSLANGAIIDANQPLDKVCEDFQDVVIHYLADRTQRRYGQ